MLRISKSSLLKLQWKYVSWSVNGFEILKPLSFQCTWIIKSSCDLKRSKLMRIRESSRFFYNPRWCRRTCGTCSSGRQAGRQTSKLSLHLLLPEAAVWAVSQREPPAEKKKTKTTKDPPLLVSAAWNCPNRPGVEKDRWSPQRQTEMIPQTHPDTTPQPDPPTAAAGHQKPVFTKQTHPQAATSWEPQI